MLAQYSRPHTSCHAAVRRLLRKKQIGRALMSGK